MKFIRRIISTILLMTIAFSAMAYFFWYKPYPVLPAIAYSYKDLHDNSMTILRLRQKAASLVQYSNENGFNTTRCFLIDMRVPSGQKRFFVYNMKKDQVEMSGLVAHGSGSATGEEELFFSNTPNSNCTSLGKYKIGKCYMGKYGLAYKLYGLDNSNSNAFDRAVVLYGFDCIPDEEVFPSSICQSWGCPTVAPAFLDHLKTLINKSEKPILLWIYY